MYEYNNLGSTPTGFSSFVFMPQETTLNFFFCQSSKLPTKIVGGKIGMSREPDPIANAKFLP